MPVYQQVIIGVFALIMLIAVIKLFSAPLRWVLKLVFNTLLGFLGLFLFNLTGVYTGVTLGLNLINAVVIGIFGLPGLALLLFIKWMFPV
jgi:inhibitor of the pro-sigma K processing machinery